MFPAILFKGGVHQMFNYKNINIEKSRTGYGIFAKKDFLKDEEIFEIKGKLMTLNEDEDIDEKIRNNAFRFSKDKYISPQGEIGDFLNHSCNPNSGIIKIRSKLLLIAVRNIKKGEEITMDYSTIIADDDIWEMNCNCGEKECRSIIKNFGALSKKLKEKYLSLGIVPDYIC